MPTNLIPEDKSTQYNMSNVMLTLDQMVIDSLAPDPDDVLKQGEPFQLRLRLTFSGPGAAALVALNASVRVRWSAESVGPGPELILGDANLNTTGGTFVYTSQLVVNPNPLTAEFVYKIAASVRVGSVGFPAAINGFIEGGAIEIYNP